jgi:hypothetical protein
MDNRRLTGFVLRQVSDSMTREINAVLPADIEIPVERAATVSRLRELHRQLGTWLAIADGERPEKSSVLANQPASPRPPLTQRQPQPAPEIHNHQ